MYLFLILKLSASIRSYVLERNIRAIYSENSIIYQEYFHTCHEYYMNYNEN
jgi:regulator of replication initiation timing